jgi:hypothetical protein
MNSADHAFMLHFVDLMLAFLLLLALALWVVCSPDVLFPPYRRPAWPRRRQKLLGGAVLLSMTLVGLGLWFSFSGLWLGVTAIYWQRRHWLMQFPDQ